MKVHESSWCFLFMTQVIHHGFRPVHRGWDGWHLDWHMSGCKSLWPHRSFCFRVSWLLSYKWHIPVHMATVWIAHIYIYISPSELWRSHIEIQKIKNVEKTKVIAFEAFWDPCRPSGSYWTKWWDANLGAQSFLPPIAAAYPKCFLVMIGVAM